ncbi:MAG: L-glutamine:2-deoxy-scyllo-inosose aminotransferase [Firmicutes bacterium ADurb.Bin262]|nr:MAG: L-glutamine:2-deoxy-scyllo-inosose aminotransferase [Firmicutes bacterium ADurb.Bin262]
MEKLAIFGGEKAVANVPGELFKWPIVTPEDEAAVLEVLRHGAMSATDVTTQFEREFAAWQGSRHALAFCNGTMALQAAMYAIGLGAGDELICPSKSYWGCCVQAFNLGATVVFADIEEHSLCLDPDDLERCVGPDTRAVMVVHYLGHPADMDRIMAFAAKHGLKVIEDVSHAQGGLYKGKKLGTFGDVGAMSLMSGKSFAIGEGGMLVTDNREAYDRALAYAHYERSDAAHIVTPYLLRYQNIALGGMKGRLNQMSAAMGRVQLKYYDERAAEIRRAMNYFWDALEGVQGVRAHRVDEATGSTMAGWYAPHGFFVPEEAGGLALCTFCEALNAEGFGTRPYGNFPLHTHRFFSDFDRNHTGKPTRIAYSARDVRELDAAVKVSGAVNIFSVPWFKKYMPEAIDSYVHAVKKVLVASDELLALPVHEPDTKGCWSFFNRQ